MDLNLNKIVAALEARSGELEQQILNLDTPDPQTFTDRYDALLELLTQVRSEILSVRTLRNNTAASSMIVNPASPAEIAELTASLKALDRVIRVGEVFDQVIATATEALIGSAKLRSAAGQGPEDTKTNITIET